MVVVDEFSAQTVANGPLLPTSEFTQPLYKEGRKRYKGEARKEHGNFAHDNALQCRHDVIMGRIGFLVGLLKLTELIQSVLPFLGSNKSAAAAAAAALHR